MVKVLKVFEGVKLGNSLGLVLGFVLYRRRKSCTAIINLYGHNYFFCTATIITSVMGGLVPLVEKGTLFPKKGTFFLVFFSSKVAEPGGSPQILPNAPKGSTLSY